MSSPQIQPFTRLTYRPAELQQILGIGKHAAYALARRIGRRVGKSIIVSKASLEEWLSSREEAPQ